MFVFVFVFVFGEAGEVGGEVDDVNRLRSCSCAEVGEDGEDVCEMGAGAIISEVGDAGEVGDSG